MLKLVPPTPSKRVSLGLINTKRFLLQWWLFMHVYRTQGLLLQWWITWLSKQWNLKWKICTKPNSAWNYNLIFFTQILCTPSFLYYKILHKLKMNKSYPFPWVVWFINVEFFTQTMVRCRKHIETRSSISHFHSTHQHDWLGNGNIFRSKAPHCLTLFL
jgi:hypothetical protein